MRARQMCAALIVGVTTAAVAAQAPQADGPRFEVASVKLNTATAPNTPSMLALQPGGRFVATYIPLRVLVSIAYGEDSASLPAYRIEGNTDLLNSMHVDVVAKARSEGDLPPGFPCSATFRAGCSTYLPSLLRSLLADRLHLLAHVEHRELPVWGLVKAKSDASFGPQLRPSAADCTAAPTRNALNGQTGCGFRFGSPQAAVGGRRGHRVSATGVTTLELTKALSGFLGRSVIDQTRLTGAFDLLLEWMEEPTVADLAPASEPEPPGIFTAVQEQLGLKLETSRGPVDVLVIDHVEHPTED